MHSAPKKLSKILTIGKKFHSTFSKDEDETSEFMCHALSKARARGLLTYTECLIGKNYCMKLVSSISPNKISLRRALRSNNPGITEKELIKLIRKTWLETIRNLKAKGN